MHEEVFGAGADAGPRPEPGRELVEATVLNFAVALGHETRIRMLVRYWNDGPASAQMMSRRGINSLAVCAYHNSRLESAGAIREIERRPKRGAVEHIFAITDFGVECLKVASTISAHDDRG